MTSEDFRHVELFQQALERLETGEPRQDLAASVDEGSADIEGMLALVALLQTKVAPVPDPTAALARVKERMLASLPPTAQTAPVAAARPDARSSARAHRHAASSRTAASPTGTTALGASSHRARAIGARSGHHIG